jgi:hypothetical protein
MPLCFCLCLLLRHFLPPPQEEAAQARATLDKLWCLRRGQGAILFYHTR